LSDIEHGKVTGGDAPSATLRGGEGGPGIEVSGGAGRRSLGGSLLMNKLSRGLIVAALMLVAALPTEATEMMYSAEYQACTSEASSTAQTRACINEELAGWTVRLDAAYRDIQAARGAPPKAKSELAQAQRSWMTFRKQACVAEGDLAATEGTAAPAVAIECALALTARRTIDLERLSRFEQRTTP
jgi:uncharacterized protein YecT (DUF1311 family)